MRAVLLLILLVLLAVAIMAAVRLMYDAAARRHMRRQPWSLKETSDGEALHVYVVKDFEEPLLVEAIPFAAEDFDMKLYDARAKAAERLIALNSGRELLR